MPNQRPPFPNQAPPPLAGYQASAERTRAPLRKGPVPPMRAGDTRAPRRRGGFFRGLLYCLFFVLTLAGAGAGYLLLNPPSEFIRQKLVAQVKTKTGRDLVIAGPTTFSLFPALGVSMHDVTLSAPEGMGGKPLVTMAALDVAVKTGALFKGEVGVKQLVLKQPVFDLRVDKTGRKSWDFSEAGGPVRLAQAQPVPANDAGPQPQAGESSGGIQLPKRLTDIRKLQLDDVRIVDGTLRLGDERSGKSQAMTAVNVQVAVKSWTAPATAKGDLVWQGEKTDFDGKLTNARTMLEEKPAKLEFTAANRHITTSYDGNVLIKDGADLDGKITVSAPSVRGLAKWLGTELPKASGFGPLTFSGNVRTAGEQTILTGGTLGLDGATAQGDVTVTKGAVRPHVEARLKISELDLNKYQETSGSAADAPTGKPAGQVPSADSKGQSADQIELLLHAPQGVPGAKGPKVQGYTQRAGWSNAPFNLTLLGLADTEATLSVGRLLFQDIKVGQSALTVGLKNKVLKTSFDKVQVYDGQGSGFLNVDASSGKTAVIGANFALDGVSALPLLRDAADIEWLSGKAKIDFQLSAQGSNELQLVESLNGKASFAFADGTIVGFNVPGAIRGISQGNFSGLKKAPSEKTDFSELSASFNVANGVAQNSDLKLTSPLLRVGGGGNVELPGRTVDYTVKPKIVASLEGQQGAANVSGIEIPVRISGPWSKLAYEPDFKGVLSDPNKVVDTVKQIGKQFKGKSGKEIVDGLLGKKSGDTTTGSTDTKAKAKDLLNKFIKPQ